MSTRILYIIQTCEENYKSLSNRTSEESIITGSKGEAESAEQTKMSAMHNGRSQVTGDLDSLQNVAADPVGR